VFVFITGQGKESYYNSMFLSQGQGEDSYYNSYCHWNLMDYFLFSAKLVPVGYGIRKLQIGCVVEDDKVSFKC
jgi:hypothetical protein